MTKDILVSICGMQFMAEDDGDADPVEIIAPGEYYNKNGKHYVLYDELMEGFEETTKNVIKISENCLDITKKGVANVHMIFEKNKKNVTHYYTPFGSILVGIDAKQVEITETEDLIDVKVNYDLEVNYEFLANCNITMKIQAKGTREFSLA